MERKAMTATGYIGCVCAVIVGLIGLRGFIEGAPAGAIAFLVVAVMLVPFIWRNAQLRKAPYWTRWLAGVAVMIVGLALTTSNKSPAPPSPAATSAASPATPDPVKAADASAMPIKDCSSFSEMLDATKGIDAISAEEAGHLCEIVTRINGKAPQLNELRFLMKGVIILQFGPAHLDKTSVPGLGQAVMDVVEARQLQGDPKRAMDTMDMLVKIGEGTNGLVTPRDVDLMLRNAGPLATTMSDEGIMNMAAVIEDQKKQAGEDIPS